MEIPPRRTVFVVGIGGPTCSGKSTLATELAEALNTPFQVASADDYFKIPSDWPTCTHGYADHCEESADTIDHEALTSHLDRVVEQLRNASHDARPRKVGMIRQRTERINDLVFVVVEGFFIFAEARLVGLCDYLIWLDADRGTCFQRASKPRFGHRTATEADFSHRWQGYMDWLPHMIGHLDGAQTGVTKLSEILGETSLGKVAQHVVERLHHVVEHRFHSTLLPANVDSTDEVFKVTLMKTRDGLRHYLVVETVSGRTLVSGQCPDGTAGWFEPGAYPRLF